MYEYVHIAPCFCAQFKWELLYFKGKIRKVVESARDEGIAHGAFVHTMTGGTYQEQKDNTAQIPAQELIYYCAVLCGPWDVVSQLTKKLSLYKG